MLMLSSLLYTLNNHPSFRLFFFDKSLDPLDLHSFPTRRSSDLLWIIVVLFVRSPREDGTDEGSSQLAGQVDQRRCHIDIHRSEEHTSELQSRGHLVCRLLLEKKKNKDETQSADKIQSKLRRLYV